MKSFISEQIGCNVLIQSCHSANPPTPPRLLSRPRGNESLHAVQSNHLVCINAIDLKLHDGRTAFVSVHKLRHIGKNNLKYMQACLYLFSFQQKPI